MFFATRLYTRILILITIALSVAIPSRSGVDKDRKAAAASLADVIGQSQLHKIYVSDFLDSAGTQTEKGCYLGGTLMISTHVTENGTVDDVRLVRGLDSDLDEAALRIIRTWKLQPAKDSSEALIPSRVRLKLSSTFISVWRSIFAENRCMPKLWSR